MWIYQAPDGTGLSKKGWEDQNMSSEWTVREYKNEKLWIRFHWVGRYKKDLPSEYRHSFGLQVYNRVILTEEDWGQITTIDKGWVLDITGTQTFRTKVQAEAAFEDMLLRYTESALEMDEDGDMVFVEAGNKLKPKAENRAQEMMQDEEAVAAAAEKGVDLGGWS